MTTFHSLLRCCQVAGGWDDPVEGLILKYGVLCCAAAAAVT